jgi:hypothetical protein
MLHRNRRPAAARATATAGAASALALLLSACSPTLDWRQVRPEGSGVEALFPCKPSSMAREVLLGGAKVRLSLHACRAGDITWAMAWADMADPARVGPALAELRQAAATNVGATESREVPLQVPGATPAAGSARLVLKGRMPDGREAYEQVAVFSRGTRVYQATAVGQREAGEALEPFFAGLRADG